MFNTFEGGTNGVTVTNGNSGGASGTALTINNPGSNALVFSTAAAKKGSLGCRMTLGTTATDVRWVSAQTGRVGVRRPLPELPTGSTVSAATTLLSLRNDAATPALMCNVVLRTNKTIRIAPVGADDTASTSITVPADRDDLWLELYITPGSTTSNGVAEYRIVEDDGTELDQYINSACNVTTGNAAQPRFGGMLSTQISITADDLDDIQFTAIASGYLDQLTPLTPTVDAGAHQNVAAGAVVTLGGSVSDATDQLWTFDYPTSGAPSLTGDTTLTPTFTASSTPGTLYVLRLTAENDSYATSAFDTMEVRVPESASTLQMLVRDGTGFGAGTWTRTGAATTDGAALNDALDGTYTESPTLSASATSERYRFEASAARSAAQLTVRLAKSDSGSATVTVKLFQGGTELQSWPVTVTTTPTDYVLTLIAGTISAITDWGELWLEVGGVA